MIGAIPVGLCAILIAGLVLAILVAPRVLRDLQATIEWVLPILLDRLPEPARLAVAPIRALREWDTILSGRAPPIFPIQRSVFVGGISVDVRTR